MIIIQKVQSSSKTAFLFLLDCSEGRGATEYSGGTDQQLDQWPVIVFNSSPTGWPPADDLFSTSGSAVWKSCSITSNSVYSPWKICGFSATPSHVINSWPVAFLRSELTQNHLHKLQVKRNNTTVINITNYKRYLNLYNTLVRNCKKLNFYSFFCRLKTQQKNPFKNVRHSERSLELLHNY